MSLISVADLAARLHHPALAHATAVCDVRFYLSDHEQGRREYDRAHIPGSVLVDLHSQLAGGPGGGRHPLPPVDDFVRLLGRLGISPATYVVAYDSAGGGTAARLWWMLRSIGHGQVAVLDGGLPAWERAGYPLTAEVATVDPVTYPPVDGWSGIVDSRAGERFRGEVETIDKQAGHIPGAINLFHAENLTPDGSHRPVRELAERFAGVGDSPIVYCGSGVTACHNLLAMSLVGICRARLYPGSWSEWSSDPERPIATGD